jgi:hypothetical protein
MRMNLAVATSLLLATVQPAAAAGPAAQFLVKLFNTVCVPNLGQPTKVREWAQEHHLAQVQNPEALNVFVGSGEGSAWAILDEEGGKFALSIRGATQACAVWAQTADPGEVLLSFKQTIEGIRRPDVQITVEKDTASPSPLGEVRVLVYNVAAPGAPTSVEYTLLTTERTGGAFQASMQAAKASAHQAPTK